MPWAGLPAVIVADFGANPQAYSDQGKPQDCPRPEKCLKCQATGSLIGHGYYHRKPKDKQRAYSIWVKRWKCKLCGHTCCSLPSFLLAQRHYLVESIQTGLSARFEGEGSWAEVVASCARAGTPALRTLQRWCQSFAEQACRWLGGGSKPWQPKTAVPPGWTHRGKRRELAARLPPCSRAAFICWPGLRRSGRNWRATAGMIG